MVRAPLSRPRTEPSPAPARYTPPVLLASFALAATLPTTPARRCENADVVLVAEVTGSTGEPGDANTPRTRWDLAVERVLKGRAPDSALTPGGVFGGLRLTISEAAPLRVDHRYLLFLHVDPTGAWVMGVDGAVPLALPGAEGDVDWARLAPTLGSCAPR